MPLQQIVNAGVTLFGDGTSTTFAVDLQRDIYFLESNTIQNWKQQTPAAVFTFNSGQSVSLSGNVVTITFTTAPTANSIVSAAMGLLYL